MWCYQKPGFEALLLAELQRQQQHSQFCDTVLRTEGVSVPAHSCILSAISPHISSALSSEPAPPAGQSRLLEFRALGDCTLLHLVRLLYSGEMAGEGEKEKQEAKSAAAKLGIHGLVEVTKRDCKGRKEEGEGRHADVGVQTEPLMPEENEGRRGRWRREVRDGGTFLWRETLSEGEKDTWTQTEELQVNTGPPSHPAASFETIDMAALQSLGQTDPHLLPPQIPYAPLSLIYPPDNSSSPLWQESTAAGHTSVADVAPPYTSAPPSLLPFSSQATLCAADPQSWWDGPQGGTRDVAAAEECEDEGFKQFQGNIPGYISHFLNPENEESSRGGRGGRRRGARVGGARRAGTGERRARRPRARTGGRGRGGLTQTVDVQEVGVSKLQKFVLQRWETRVSRTGQGGGAAGRKLYLKTRELLKPAKSCQRRRRRGKVWEFSQSGDLRLHSEGGEGNTQRGRSNTPQQDGLPVDRAQRARAKPTASVSFSSPPMRFYNVCTLSASSPSLQPSPSPGLLSPAASYVAPVSSLLHTTCLPPPAPQPHEEEPEHFDRLLEEVMMGLDIFPNNNNNNSGASQPPPPSSSSSCTYASSGNTLAQNKLQVHGSTQVVAVSGGAGGSSSANGEVTVLQQQGEGELNAMVEHFLQSFEQHIDSSSAREEVEMGDQSSPEARQPYTVQRKYRKTNTQTTSSSQITELQQNHEAETPPGRSQPHKPSAHSAAPPTNTEGTPQEVRALAKRRKKRRKNEYLFSVKKKKVRKRVSSSDVNTQIVRDGGDKQLQHVETLEGSGPLPVKVTLQGRSCQSLEVKSPAKTKTSSSSVKYPQGRWITKTYPIRSRFREAHIMDSVSFHVEPLDSAGQLACRQRRLSNGDSATPPIQPQPESQQPETNQERNEEEVTVQQQEEAEGPTRRGKKRGPESEEETSNDAAVAKRRKEKPVWSEIKLRETEESWMDEEMESSGGEIIDVNDDCRKEAEKGNERRRSRTTLSHVVKVNSCVSPPSHPAKEVGLGSTGSWEEDMDEDIDVIGDCSPVPEPVIISWTDSSAGEEEEGDEDVDVV